MFKSTPIPKLTPAQIEAFWSRVEVHQPAGCWEWIGPKQKRGYGTFASWLAHRVSYSLLIDAIPRNMVIDHLCRNHSCVNPDHLQIKTHRENNLAGHGPIAKHARKTHCKHGHEFTPENTRITVEGARFCRECGRIFNRKRRAARRSNG